MHGMVKRVLADVRIASLLATTRCTPCLAALASGLQCANGDWRANSFIHFCYRPGWMRMPTSSPSFPTVLPCGPIRRPFAEAVFSACLRNYQPATAGIPSGRRWKSTVWACYFAAYCPCHELAYEISVIRYVCLSVVETAQSRRRG